jgi:glyoxylase-like metal-dependent hydrolase (beta-lactamase superfamily II)
MFKKTHLINSSVTSNFFFSILIIFAVGCAKPAPMTTEQIAPGIYCIRATRSNVYLLAGKTLVLIDTGMPQDGVGILQEIAALGRKPGDVSHILITHAHLDHTGSLAFLKKATGAKVVASAAEGDYIRGDKKLWQMNREGIGGKLFKAALFIAETFFYTFQPAAVDTVCAGGEMIDWDGGVQVIATPGHSLGSLSYLLPGKGALFTGDALSGEPEPRLPLRSGCADYRQALESVKKLAALKFEICCFGHGKTVTSGADEVIRKLIADAPQ